MYVLERAYFEYTIFEFLNLVQRLAPRSQPVASEWCCRCYANFGSQLHVLCGNFSTNCEIVLPDNTVNKQYLRTSERLLELSLFSQ